MTIAHLDDRAVVRVVGPDAAALLHNVLTLDMGRMQEAGIGYGALLTPQGKILWDFLLHRIEDGFAVDIRKGEEEAFAKRLSLYRLRAKVDIAAAPELGVRVEWGASSDGPADPRVPELGARWVAPVAELGSGTNSGGWHRHRIALAVPEGGIDFPFGDTFPHDAAMDSLNGVDFGKGCYVGQEVVSRMRHRGTARRRIVAIEANGVLPEPGAEIVAGERPLGRLGSSASGKAIGLVRLDRLRSALDEGLPVRAGAEEIDVALPSWATYDWPATVAGEE